MVKTLFEHASYELQKLGLHLDGDKASIKILTDTIALVKKFEKQNHDEYTSKWVLEFFETICQHLPLSPITDDADEWEGFEDTHKNLKTGKAEVTVRWQNKRAPSIISMDDGKTFVDLRTNKEGVAVDHIKQAKEWAEQRQERLRAKEEAENPKLPSMARPPVDTSTPPGEEAAAAQAPVPSDKESLEQQARTTESEKAN